MTQRHERRTSTNPYINTVWQSTALSDGDYLVTPDASWDLISAQKANGQHIVFLSGQVTKPTRLPYKAGEQSVVISFTAGAYIPYLTGVTLTDNFVMLPLEDELYFRLADHTFPLPTFQNAEVLVTHMVEYGILKNDALVSSMLYGAPKASSTRSVQRHFKATTGLTHKKLKDIQRAQQAVRLLKDGNDPSLTAADAGYYDQAHLTKSLKRLMDSLPSDVDDINQV